jgi:hypothetical protein
VTLLSAYLQPDTAFVSSIATADVLSPLAMHVPHTCSPNVVLLYGDRVRAYAVRDIADGDAITRAVVPEALLETKSVLVRDEDVETCMLARRVLLDAHLHGPCTCARCMADARARVSAPADATPSSITARMDIQRNAPEGALQSHVMTRNYMQFACSMDETVHYGVIDVALGEMALVRWPVACAHRDDAGTEFMYLEAVSAVRAWVWSGGEALLGRGRRSERAVALRLRHFATSATVLEHSVMNALAHVPGIELARLHALALLATLYALTPSLRALRPPSRALWQAWRAEPLLRIVLADERRTLFRRAVAPGGADEPCPPVRSDEADALAAVQSPLLTWFDTNVRL